MGKLVDENLQTPCYNDVVYWRCMLLSLHHCLASLITHSLSQSVSGPTSPRPTLPAVGTRCLPGRHRPGESFLITGGDTVTVWGIVNISSVLATRTFFLAANYCIYAAIVTLWKSVTLCLVKLCNLVWIDCFAIK